MVLILAIVLPIVAAVMTQTQTLHIAGNAKYPNLPPFYNPTPTPIPTPTSTTLPSFVQFSLFFPNGTVVPNSLTGELAGGVNTVVVDPLQGHNAGWTPTCIVICNDGNIPITVTASVTNENVPSNINLTLSSGYYGAISGAYGFDKATNQQPIQPGQTYYMSLIAFLYPTTADYVPGQLFSYNYDVVLVATQA
ncbi:MAG: hypothetical protein LBQ98_05170 [Nitrososphaerota archaeon]|jgi:hypothetical protein|nr:hypothetical protein [Nitrososphaerota archaeon]